jgi:hypothetical protein
MTYHYSIIRIIPQQRKKCQICGKRRTCEWVAEYTDTVLGLEFKYVCKDCILVDKL